VSINRHNYEEFFLLYVDDELQQPERVEVENFVKQNPDLASELEMLQQATLDTEDFTFDQKELLYKKEDSISLANYEEYFVLSVDDELKGNEADKVEKFVLKHPELQDEFTLLKQTKMAPEVVEFAHKEVLYKTEKERRVIPFLWMKVSVAAAVIGLVAFTWIFNNNSNNGDHQRFVTASAKPATTPTEDKNLAATVTQQPLAPLKDNTGNNEQADVATTQPQLVQQQKTLTGTKGTKNSEDAVAIKKKRNAVKDIFNTPPALAATNEQPKETIENTVPVRNNPKVINNSPANATFATLKNIPEETNYSRNAVYREIDTNEEDNPVYVGGTEINKNKLKGLFKKAAKLIGKKSSENDDEKTVKIAGFEFKTK